MSCGKVVTIGTVCVLLGFLVDPAISRAIYSNYGPECREAYSCVNGTTLEWDSYGYIMCSGYHSCTELDKIEITGSADMMCMGSYSCCNADLLFHNYDVRAKIEC